MTCFVCFPQLETPSILRCEMAQLLPTSLVYKIKIPLWPKKDRLRRTGCHINKNGKINMVSLVLKAESCPPCPMLAFASVPFEEHDSFIGICFAGNLEWLDKNKSSFLIMWRRPEEWGKLIYQWVSRSGQNNSVFTLYELTSGEDTEEEEFHGLDEATLLRALQALQQEHKAEIITVSDGRGVKFF